MKNKSKLLAMALAIVLILAVFAGCTPKEAVPDGDTKPADSSDATTTEPVVPAATGGEIEVSFWTAPEQYNYDIWSKYAEAFNATNAQLDGKTIKVVVQQMPTQPSSEAGIQNAIATSTVPVLSENINRGFAATLADSQAVYDISGEDWFKEVVEERQIDGVVEGWGINGAQYVIPLYVNPIGYYWNSKALAALGITTVPTTTAELDAAIVAYSANTAALSEIGVSHFMYRHELTRPDSWWERWFDFEAQYNAFSQGGSIVENGSLTLDKDAAQKVFEMYGKIGNGLLIGEIPNIWQETNVPVVMGLAMPWDIQPNKAAGKTYGMDSDYVFGPMLIENAGDTSYTFADSKGIVFYKNAAISEEQHNAGVEFIKYVFVGGGKDTFDIDWLDTTTMLPVRGDLATNPSLTSYFESNPELKDVATFVSYGIPCMDNPKMAEIMTALAEGGLTPYISGEATSTVPGSAPDATAYVEAAAEAMITAGELK